MTTFFPKKSGFTFTELLVVIFVFFVLLWAALPRSGGLVKGPLIQAVNNARQIHIATMSMAIDGTANGNSSLGWPGDLKDRGQIQNLQDFVKLLVKEDYLRPNDLKVFCAKGLEPYVPSDNSGALVPPFEEKNNAFKIYLMRQADPENTVFLATKNYTYNSPLNAKAKPFGEMGFVIARKGGDVSIYSKKQVQNLKPIGLLPGGGTTETPENCLNP